MSQHSFDCCHWCKFQSERVVKASFAWVESTKNQRWSKIFRQLSGSPGMWVIYRVPRVNGWRPRNAGDTREIWVTWKVCSERQGVWGTSVPQRGPGLGDFVPEADDFSWTNHHFSMSNFMKCHDSWIQHIFSSCLTFTICFAQCYKLYSDYLNI